MVSKAKRKFLVDYYGTWLNAILYREEDSTLSCLYKGMRYTNLVMDGPVGIPGSTGPEPLDFTIDFSGTST